MSNTEGRSNTDGTSNTDPQLFRRSYLEPSQPRGPHLMSKSELIAAILRDYWKSHRDDTEWLRAQYEAHGITQDDRERYDTEYEARAEVAYLRKVGEL